MRRGGGALGGPPPRTPPATRSASAPPDLLYNLQALRGYAAVSVATYHFALIPAASVPWRYGSFGVDLFFVLSGFIIAWSTRATHHGFLMHRAIRVLPAYWIATCLFGVIVLVAMPTDAALGWIGRSLLFLHGPDGRPPLLFVGWTLVYELVFYLLYAGALRAGPRRAPLLAIAALPVLAYGGRLIGVAPRDWPLLIEFGLGLAIFLWVDRRPTPFPPGAAMALVIVAAALLYLLEPGRHGQDGGVADLIRVAALGVPAAAVVLGLVQLERAGVAMRSRPVVALGAASYALYLLHPIVFSFVLPVPAGSIARRLAIFILLLAITVGVSLAFRAWIEVPMLRLLRRRPTDMAPSTSQVTANLSSAKDDG
ncbi:acyltransferase [Sphingomonas sp. BK580]|uniref:acyltransferase family protein n=1 Tax=Sphingomonas sp. BK580 TaxID=2586972 RepID=UPI001617E19C|nr:acyltransferase [Sphingomonas sp. BK580]MBB3695676.1 exopolysaccharide production protein ExoZ [Sphingomonas sp. BK580]